MNWTNAAIIIDENTTDVTIAGELHRNGRHRARRRLQHTNGILVAGSFNTIGGPNPEDRNVISGNSNYGIALWGTDVASNVVRNNYIGVGADGTTPLGNSEGIHFNTNSFSGRVAGSGGGGGGNIIGPANVIANNQNEGICLCDAEDNTVIGNYIGVDATGNNAAPNDTGIFTFGSDNTIGGDSAAERNVISANNGYGLDISGSQGGSGNTVIGNYIGTNASGNADLGNGQSGIFAGAGDTTIGGEGAARNVISGNGEAGVLVWGFAAVVEGNYIGTSANGQQGLGNDQYGISVEDSAAGGLIQGNVIGDNGENGISFAVGTSGAQVFGNRIGVGASGGALGNTLEGVYILNANDHQIGGTGDGEANIIANNGSDGVIVRNAGGPAVGNSIRANSIHSNGGLGINNVDGGNNELAPPVVNEPPLRAGLEVSGTACPSCTIDVFSDDEDEGRVYEGSTVANGVGAWFFTGDVSGPFTTATATDPDGNTSEFSAPIESPVEVTPTPEPTDEPTPAPTETPEPTATPTPSQTPGPTETPAPGARQGDTDCDKDADSVDGLFVLRDVAGFAPSKCIENGDVDCDEDRDSVDALGILRYVAALPPLVQQEPCANIGEPI